jgi:hypothetical protein
VKPIRPEDRLEAAAEAIKQYNPSTIESIEDYSAKDLAKIAADQNISPEQMPKLVGIMVYMRKRLIENKSRVAAFKAAFPERCIVSKEKSHVAEAGKFATSREIGEPLDNSTIAIKAKRLENSQMYMSVYQLMQSNLFISYAVDRMKVLDEALHIALDPMTPLRDKDRYMKMFLEETRKPDNAKAMEFNVNIQNNHIDLATVEDKMNTIAQALNHASAAEVIDIVHQGRSDDS